MTAAPFSLTITYDVHCSECGVPAPCEQWRVVAGAPIPVATLPAGWTLYIKLGDWWPRAICPKHRLEQRILEDSAK